MKRHLIVTGSTAVVFSLLASIAFSFGDIALTAVFMIIAMSIVRFAVPWSQGFSALRLRRDAERSLAAPVPELIRPGGTRQRSAGPNL